MLNQNCTVKALDRSNAAADVGTLGELHALIFKEPWSTEDIARFTMHSSTQAFIAYVGREKPVGLALARHARGEGEVLTFGVALAFRRTGVGDALLTEVLKWSIGVGLESLYLEVCETNLAARLLYKKHGFQYGYRRKQYYRVRSGASKDAVVLVKNLGAKNSDGTGC